jgi:hypothetical protein
MVMGEVDHGQRPSAGQQRNMDSMRQQAEMRRNPKELPPKSTI